MLREKAANITLVIFNVESFMCESNLLTGIFGYFIRKWKNLLTLLYDAQVMYVAVAARSGH